VSGRRWLPSPVQTRGRGESHRRADSEFPCVPGSLWVNQDDLIGGRERLNHDRVSFAVLYDVNYTQS